VAIERQGGAGREQQGGGAEGRERSVGVGEAEGGEKHGPGHRVWISKTV
jgi:hypothetical protein